MKSNNPNLYFVLSYWTINKMLNSYNGILIHSTNVVKFITPNLESICTYLYDFAFHQNVSPHAIASLHLIHQGGGKKQIL